MDITWNGNTATINLDTLEDSAGYNGYFSAIGESDLPIDELEGLKVVVTLYQDGEAVSKEISVPFEIVAYEGDGEEPTEEDPEEDPAEESGESEDPSDEDGEQDDDETNPEKDGSEGQPSGDDDQGTTSDENQQQDHDGDDPVSKVNDTNTENTSNSTDEDSSSDEKDVSIGEKSEEDDESETTAVATDNNDHTLPATATNLYNILLAGFIFIVAGAATLFIRKRKMN